VCKCVRCREIQDHPIKKTELRITKYIANEGQEIFISIDEPDLDKLIALCRLRFPSDPKNPILPELKDAALVRELHVYGQQQSLGKGSVPSKTQHFGLGKQLMKKAEELSNDAGFRKVAVISAIGTREYYRKLGYELEGTYMVKYLTD
jgi:elongator complex protein 3